MKQLIESTMAHSGSIDNAKSRSLCRGRCARRCVTFILTRACHISKVRLSNTYRVELSSLGISDARWSSVPVCFRACALLPDRIEMRLASWRDSSRIAKVCANPSSIARIISLPFGVRSVFLCVSVRKEIRIADKYLPNRRLNFRPCVH